MVRLRMELYFGALWIILPVVAFDAIGQKLPERGYIITDAVDVTDIDESTQYYDWNHLEDPDVWRWNVKDYPHPQETPRFCNRLKWSNICDPDQILSREQADLLDIQIRKFFNATRCICEKCSPSQSGIQIGVALLKYLYKPHNEKFAKVMQSFAKNIRSKWQLGDCDDDILIVLATQDRQSYTDVGSRVLRFIPQDEAHRIFLENKAHFSEKRYYQGIEAMLSNYTELASRIPADDEEEEDVKVGKIIGIVIGLLVFVALLALAIIWAYKKYRRKVSEDSSSDNGGDVESSTWRKNISLTPHLFSGKDTYKPCKTVDDDIVQEQLEPILITELPVRDDPSSVQHPEKNSEEAASTPDKTPYVGYKQVTPEVPNGLHQTDL